MATNVTILVGTVGQGIMRSEDSGCVGGGNHPPAAPNK
jgi:hypothetical protein